MKTIQLLFLTFITVATYAQPDTVRTSYIFHSVSIQAETNDELEEDWHNNLEPSKHYKLTSELIKIVNNPAIKIYHANISEDALHPCDLFKEEISVEDRNKILGIQIIETQIDEHGDEMYDSYTGEPLYAHYFDPYTIANYVSVSFLEKWTYSKNTFFKDVLGLTLNVLWYDENGDIKGEKPVFYIPFNQGETQPLETDLIQASLRVRAPMEDVNSGMLSHQWWIDNVELSKRHFLFESRLAEVRNGERNVFKPEYPYDQLMLKNEALRSCQYYIEALMVDDFGDEVYDDYTGEPILVTDTFNVEYFDIVNVDFVEDWYFNADNLTFIKQVHGIIPNDIVMDDSGDYIGEVSMHFIPLNGSKITRDESASFSVPRVESSQLMATYYEQLQFTYNSKEPQDQATNLRQDKFRNIFVKLFKSVEEGKTQVYETNFFSNKLSTEYPWNKDSSDLRRLTNFVTEKNKLDEYDKYVFDEETGDHITITEYQPILPNQIINMKFNESWDASLPSKFDKKVVGFAPGVFNKNESGNITGIQDLFYFENEKLKSSEEMTNPDLLIGRNVRSIVRIKNEGTEIYKEDGQIGYAPLYNAWWNENIEASVRQGFLNDLFTGIKSRKYQIYETDSSAKPIKSKLAPNYLINHDTLIIYNEDSGSETFEATTEEYVASEINYLEFVENWYIDPETFQIHKEVIGFSPVYRRTNVFKGLEKEVQKIDERRLFYFKLDSNRN